MSITLYPYKLLMGEMEARIPGGLALLPGQFLRFSGTEPVYGRITGVRVVRKKTQTAEGGSKSKVAGSVVRLQLLHGQPDLSPQTVTILNDAQMAAEVQRLQEPVEQPVALSPDLTVDATRLGQLTLIEGDDFVLKYQTLMAFVSGVQRHQKVLIIDPLGLFEESNSLHYCQAGQDMRLSIQSIGHQRFLDAFGELFPSGLRNWALQAVAASWPITQDFIGFERLLDWRFVSESPLKSLILQNQQAVLRTGVFAERPNQVMQWTSLTWQSCNVIDLSALSSPWKALFYEEAVRLVLKEADAGILPVLIYPEHYLSHWPDWLKQAEESGLNFLVLASAEKTDSLEKMVTTRVTAKSLTEICLGGRLTSGLPITFSLQASDTARTTKRTAEAMSLEDATIADLTTYSASAPKEAPTQFTAEQWMTQQPEPIQEHHQILDQLFANQISIEQSVMGRQKQTPPPPIEVQEAPSIEPAPALDYPDADEGAWTEAASAYSPPPSKQATPLPEPVFPEADSWALNDFDFDLNLDQKPLEFSPEALSTEALRLEYSSVSGPLPELGELSFPSSMSTLGTQEPTSTWAEESTGAMDTSGAPEILPGEEVPVYHRAAEPTHPDAQSYQPGDRVRHEKYGVGVVTKIVPLNDSVVLNITFESVGKRLLDPKLAQLTQEPG